MGDFGINKISNMINDLQDSIMADIVYIKSELLQTREIIKHTLDFVNGRHCTT